MGHLLEVSHARGLKQPSVWENAKSRPTDGLPKGGIGGKPEKRPFFIPHIAAKTSVYVGTILESGEVRLRNVCRHVLSRI